MSETPPPTEASRAAVLRSIPSVERILSSGAAAAPIGRWGRERFRDSVRLVLDRLRADAPAEPPQIDGIVSEADALANLTSRPSLRRVINATGVIIHTNLGRSPLDPGVLDLSRELLCGYTNLEFDLGSGSRGKRHEHLSDLCSQVFGAEAALLVNNNAAAILLVMAALAPGREVLVSRGELVEIGGSFRVPDVIAQGGAILREVGTTNRTRASDYAASARGTTAAILRVHRSNFEIVGFTESPSEADLAAVARQIGVPLVIDEGSGRIVDISRYGFEHHPGIRELLSGGADVVTCSTDKLLGSSQGGLILGRRDLLELCARHPLMRAFRPGKESFAFVDATLRCFLRGDHEERVPVYRMLSASVAELRERASALQSAGVDVVETRALLGGGTTPTQSMISAGLRISVEHATEIHHALLQRDVPIVGRIEEGAVILDLRTIAAEDDALIGDALRQVRSG